MSFEDVQTPPALQIPNTNGPVVAPRNRAFPVGRHADAADRALVVSWEGAQTLPTLQIPHPQGSVPKPTPRNCACAVGCYTDALYQNLVPFKGAQTLSDFQIPELNDCPATHRNRALAIGRKAECQQLTFESFKGSQALRSKGWCGWPGLAPQPRSVSHVQDRFSPGEWPVGCVIRCQRKKIARVLGQ